MLTKMLVHRVKTNDVRLDVLTCVGTLAGCTLIGLLFYFLDLSEANIITIYILGILFISAVTTGRVYGIVSSVLGVLLFNSLFAVPRFTLNVYDPQYTITIIVMLGASLLTSYIMRLLRTQLQREMQDTRRGEILLEMSQALQESGDEQMVLELIAAQLHSLLGSAVLLFPVREGALQAPLVAQEASAAGGEVAMEQALRAPLQEWAAQPFVRDAKSIPYVDGRMLCYKIGFQEELYAIVCLGAGQGEDSGGFLFNLVLPLLELTANYIEKERLHAHNLRIVQEAEAERLRANLLRTISHDLRTPLTSILGNADILLGNEDKLDANSRRQLYRHIHDDSEWLIGLVENLLFVTRMENGGMQVRLETEVLQDVLPAALQHMGKRIQARSLSLDMPEELLLAQVDARLLIQVVVNMVDNAAKYTPPESPIRVLLERRGEVAAVEVWDEGPGISDEDKAHVFDMFYTADNAGGDGRRGIGLGLALCQSIVAAHGGSVYIRDNHPHGAIVGFMLTLEEVLA